jgi:predicted lipoprotein with Yx(FWY)xxD motif
MRHRTTSLSIALAAIVFTAAGCGSDAKTASTVAPTTAATAAATATTTAASTTAPTTAATTAAAPTTDAGTTAATTPAASAATVQLVQSSLGTILADAKGSTLYVFTKDSGGTSACSGGCATAWPAFTTAATPGTGLDAEDFGTIARDDGTQQVTFYGHPLYTFAGDAKPGDVTGQGSNGVWFVVGADGTPIETPASVPGY